VTACAIQVPIVIVIVIVSNLREVFNLRLLSSNCRDETVNAPYIASTPDGWVYISFAVDKCRCTALTGDRVQVFQSHVDACRSTTRVLGYKVLFYTRAFGRVSSVIV